MEEGAGGSLNHHHQDTGAQHTNHNLRWFLLGAVLSTAALWVRASQYHGGGPTEGGADALADWCFGGIDGGDEGGFAGGARRPREMLPLNALDEGQFRAQAAALEHEHAVAVASAHGGARSRVATSEPMERFLRDGASGVEQGSCSHVGSNKDRQYGGFDEEPSLI